MKRRSLTLKLLAGAISVLAVLALATVLWIDSVADRRWKELEELVARLETEARAREDARPVLRGTPIPGNAWDDYDLAIEEAAKIGSEVELRYFVTRDPSADRAVVQRTLAAHSTALGHLARGARRSIGAKAYEWSLSPQEIHSSRWSEKTLSLLAASQARIFFEEGRTADSLDLLLDLLQFGRDCQDNSLILGAMLGTAILQDAETELEPLLASGSLSPQELDRLHKVLEALTRDFPNYGNALRNETLFMGYTALKHPSVDEPGVPTIPFWRRWRYGFSDRILLVDALAFQFRLHARIARSANAPWEELRSVLAETDAEYDAAPNPVLSDAKVDQERVLKLIRLHRARLQLIRAAVVYLRTGSVPDLDDPFGTRLQHKPYFGKMRIWSIGSEGIDDKGTGEWGEPTSVDVVIDVPLKE